MIAHLLIVAQLTTVRPTGMAIDNSVGQITEPADIEPSLGAWVYQHTVDGNQSQFTGVINDYQPTVRYGLLQRTLDPEYQLNGDF